MEIWKAVPGFEGRYEASSNGGIRSLDRVTVGTDGVAKRMQGLVLRTRPNTGGYLSVRLGRGAPVMVHQVVAATFIGPRPPGHYICHCDGNRLNNTPGNLRYDTPKANQDDRAKHGTRTVGEALPQAKLTETQVREIKALIGFKSHAAIGTQFNVSRAAVYLIAAGRNWKHITKD